jgi:hypothetical protein
VFTKITWVGSVVVEKQLVHKVAVREFLMLSTCTSCADLTQDIQSSVHTLVTVSSCVRPKITLKQNNLPKYTTGIYKIFFFTS